MTARRTPELDRMGVVEVVEHAELCRRMPWDRPDAPDWARLVEREWLMTNGLGGYASGTVSGAHTRRYHGYLVGAFPPPIGRVLRGMGVVDRLYSGYGETAPAGQGPDYACMLQGGGAYLERRFPRLDHIRTARVVTIESNTTG